MPTEHCPPCPNRPQNPDQDFSGGPTVENLPANAGNVGSIPGLEGFHIPPATKPACLEQEEPLREKPALRNYRKPVCSKEDSKNPDPMSDPPQRSQAWPLSLAPQFGRKWPDESRPGNQQLYPLIRA